MGDEQSRSFHGGGKTYPGAAVPCGMVQLSPDTVTGGDNGTGYNYCDNTIEGFSVNHMSGIGWYGDLGNLQLMPVVGETDLRSGSNEEVPFTKGTVGWKSEFSHENEITTAGYYSVRLDRYGIRAEVTADVHTGMLRFVYPKYSDARLIMNFSRRIAGHADFQYVEVIDPNRIEGSIVCTPAGGGFGRGDGGIGYTLHFVVQLSCPAKRIRFFENEEFLTGTKTAYEGADLGAVLEFGDGLTDSLIVKVAISYVDIDGARRNFDAELVEEDFDRAVMNAKLKWEQALSVISVDGGTETDTTLFYTCLYHTVLDPRTAADVDGRFRIGNKILTAKYCHRTMFSGWDVYRSEFPLLTLISPEVVNDEVNSLLTASLENGTSLPRWELMGNDSGCMIGDPGLIVAADAVTKGITDFDTETLYEVAKASCTVATAFRGRPFRSVHSTSEQYATDAFVPEQLSCTVELLLANFAMHRLASALDKEEDASFFLERAMRYAENYDPKLGFMAPRYADRSFVKGLDRYSTKGCIESNIFQQSWFVPYDVNGMCELFGKERAVTLLKEFFDRADYSAMWNEDYNHSNEPCHNITHYFSALGLPHLTQYYTRAVQKGCYRLGAYGFCGNEDVGQLSAWYVLSAIGFAQICPTDGKFYYNTPLFRSAKVRLDPKYHGCAVSDTLTIICDRDPNEYPYIVGLKLNGVDVNEPFLAYDELTNGGTVEFLLCKEPIKGYAF